MFGFFLFFPILGKAQVSDASLFQETRGLALVLPQSSEISDKELLWLVAGMSERFQAAGEFCSRCFVPKPAQLHRLMETCPFSERERCYELAGEKLKIGYFAEVLPQRQGTLYSATLKIYEMVHLNAPAWDSVTVEGLDPFELIQTSVGSIFQYADVRTPLLDSTLAAFPHRNEAVYGSYAIGRMKLWQGEYNSMLFPFLRALQLEPGFIPAVVGLARARSSMGLLEQARSLLESVPFESRTWEVHLELAETQLGLGQAAQAQRELSLVKVKIPNSTARYEFVMGRTHQARGAVSRALSHTISAIHKNPSVIEYYQLLGELYGARGNYSAALPYFERLIRLAPDQKDHKLYYGMALRDNRQMGPAIETFQEILVTHPRYFPARINLGISYQRLGWNEKAEKTYLSAIERGEGETDARLNLSLLWIESGKREEGLKMLRRLADKPDPDARVLYNLGLLAFRENGLKQAEKYFRAALQRDPALGKAHVVLSRIYLEWGDETREFAELNRALELHPEDFETLVALAAHQARTGELEEAILNLRTAVEVNPDALPQKLTLAHYVFMNGNRELARSQLGELRARHGSSPSALYEIAEIYFQLGFFSECLDTGRELLEIGYRPTNTRLLIGKSYTEQIFRNVSRRTDADALALEHLTAARQGQPENFDSLYWLGRYHAKVTRDYDEALKFLKLAKTKGKGEAQEQLVEAEKEYIRRLSEESSATEIPTR